MPEAFIVATARPASGAQFAERRIVLLDELKQQRRFRSVASVARRIEK